MSARFKGEFLKILENFQAPNISNPRLLLYYILEIVFTLIFVFILPHLLDLRLKLATLIVCRFF